jgi:hypothetical protein
MMEVTIGGYKRFLPMVLFLAAEEIYKRGESGAEKEARISSHHNIALINRIEDCWFVQLSGKFEFTSVSPS